MGCCEHLWNTIKVAVKYAARFQMKLVIDYKMTSTVPQGPYKSIRAYWLKSGFLRIRNDHSDTVEKWFPLAVSNTTSCFSSKHLINKTTTYTLHWIINQKRYGMKCWDRRRETVGQTNGHAVTETYVQHVDVRLSGRCARHDKQPTSNTDGQTSDSQLTTRATTTSWLNRLSTKYTVDIVGLVKPFCKSNHSKTLLPVSTAGLHNLSEQNLVF